MDSKTVNRIKLIRPYPSYYTILADTDNMNRIYETIVNSNLVKKSDKWNLMFLDFKSNQFKWDASHAGVHKLIMKNDICCAYLGQPKTCTCPTDFSVGFNWIDLLICIEYLAPRIPDIKHFFRISDSNFIAATFHNNSYGLLC